MTPTDQLHLLEYRNVPNGRLASVVRHGADRWLVTLSDWSGEHKTWRLKRQLDLESLAHAQAKAHEWCLAHDHAHHAPSET